jgi:hypothetical protein
VKIRTFTELTTPDDRSLRFTPLGFSTATKLTPESAAEYQQRSIASGELDPVVGDSTRHSFERLRLLHAYGILCYDLFTVVDDLSWVVLEQALRERFIAFYEGRLPLIHSDGHQTDLEAANFETLSDTIRRGSSGRVRSRPRLASPSGSMPVPLTLRPLLRWARGAGLLHGQRNRRMEQELFHRMRNRFAHGGEFRIGMPPDSARRICDLAEILNRLWGRLTPGGRLYPSPLQRRVLVIGWSSGWEDQQVGSTMALIGVDQLHSHEADDWTYIVLRGVFEDQRLFDFDARYERTTYPAELLHGPDTRSGTVAWLDAVAPVGDEVSHLDRLFAIRRHADKAYLPCSPEILLSLPVERQGGAWHVVRADFADDALVHARHVHAGVTCPDAEFGGCAVEDLAQGSWSDVVTAVVSDCPGIQPGEYSEVHLPRRWSLPDSVGSS